MKIAALITIAVLAAGSTAAYAADALTAKDGMTLYTFDKDTAGTSVCYDDCEVNWPPYIAADGAEVPGLTIIERNDGAKQWAKAGKPLYFWVGDSAPGETNGDGVGGVWHVAH